MTKIKIGGAWLRFIAGAGLVLGWLFLVLYAPQPDMPASQLVEIIKLSLTAIGAYHAADKAPNGAPTVIRILSGAGLFGVWIALVASHRAPAGDLADALALAVAGLAMFSRPDQGGDDATTPAPAGDSLLSTGEPK